MTNTEIADLLEHARKTLWRLGVHTDGPLLEGLSKAAAELRSRASEPVEVVARWVQGTEYKNLYHWMHYECFLAGEEWHATIKGSSPFSSKESAESACEQHCQELLKSLGINATIRREGV